MELDFATRALLKMLLLPPGILILALLVGWLAARRLAGRLLILLATLGLYLLSTPAVVAWLAERAETVPAPSPQAMRDSAADAILVLMAGASRSNPEYQGGLALSGLSLQRIDYGLALHRRTGLPIVLSGGPIPGEDDAADGGTTLSQLGAAWLRDRAGVEALATETASRDTWENAANSAATLRQLGLQRVLLVTHAFHMPRALLSARAAGIDAVPAPFGFQHTPPELRQPGIVEDWLPQAGNLGASYLMLHEMAGLAWYRLARE